MSARCQAVRRRAPKVVRPPLSLALISLQLVLILICMIKLHAYTTPQDKLFYAPFYTRSPLFSTANRSDSSFYGTYSLYNYISLQLPLLYELTRV
jgi:hypothetical protein